MWLGYAMLLVLLPIQNTTIARASDAYFERAIEGISRTLEHPSDSYGFVMTDIYTDLRDKNQKSIKGRYSFYTANGKIRLQKEKYDPGGYKRPRLTEVVVLPERGGDPKIVMFASGFVSQQVNVKKNFGFTMGLAGENYGVDDGPEPSGPRWLPFQILANPCFAPLPFAPEQLQALSVKALADDDGTKLYEVQEKENQYRKVLRLWFSPKNGNKLVKSEYSVVEPEGKLLHRAVRVVDAWQNLPDGTLVPATFKYELEMDGHPHTRVEREISDAIIGKIDEAMFDITKLREFQVRPQQVWDIENLKQVNTKPPSTSSRWRLPLIGLNVAVVVVATLVILLRRRRLRGVR